MHAINAFDALFGAQSSLGFTCDKCKCNQIIDNDEKIKLINEQKAKIDELEELLAEKPDIIQQLTDTNDSPNNIGAFKDDDVTPASEVFRAVSKTLLRDMRNLLSNEIEKISEHVSKECKSVKQQSKKILTEIESANKKAINPFANKNNTNQRHITPNVPLANSSDENDDVRHEQQQQQPTQVTFSEALIPTARVAMNHVLHLSKFPNNVSVDDITAHIMNNTSIIHNEEAFYVEKLGKPVHAFCSFKISAASMEIYDEIKNIWAPHYAAREFVDKPNYNNRRLRVRNQTPHRAQRNVSSRNQGSRTNGNYGNYANTPRTPHRRGKSNPFRDVINGQQTPSRHQNRNNHQNNRRDDNARDEYRETEHNSNERQQQQKPKEQVPQIIYMLPPYQQPSMQAFQPIPPNFFGPRIQPQMPVHYPLPPQPPQQ